MQMSENIGSLDMEKAIDAARVFYQISDVNVTVIDLAANVLYSCDEAGGQCSFCKRMRCGLGEGVDCDRVRLYGSYQAERFGGKYIFFCPMGLVFFASPLSVGGIMQAAYIGGPVMMVDPDEYLFEDLLARRGDMTQEDIAQARDTLGEIPHRDTVKTRYLSELLFISAAYASGGGGEYYDDSKLKEDFHSSIAEYIQRLQDDGDERIHAYPIKKEKELIHAISAGDKKRAQMLLNEILGHIFFSSGGKFEIIRARVMELVVVLSRAALDGGADTEQIFGLNYRYLSEIHRFDNIEDLSYWLSRLMTRFTECVFDIVDIKHVDVIYKAISYIRANYASKITLEEVAGYVHLSATYFSRIFKEEMHTNFNAYLNKVRIDKAKQLLHRDDISLVDISNMVGFEDQSYFSKVFKKLVGMSPGKYREQRGNVFKAENNVN